MKSASRGLLGLALGLLLVSGYAWAGTASGAHDTPKDPLGGMQAPEILKQLKPYVGNGQVVRLKLTRNTPITDPFEEVHQDVEHDIAVVSIKAVERQDDDVFITLAGIDRDASQGMSDQHEMLRISTDDGSFRLQSLEAAPEASHVVGFSTPVPTGRGTATMVKDASLQ